MIIEKHKSFLDESKSRKNICLFLDRDGVINYDYGYVHNKNDFVFIPGIFNLVKLANKLHVKVIVVTNQAGIAKGYYKINQFIELTNWMNLEFEQRSCLIDGVYFCPFHEEAVIPELKKKSNFRKPNPGMLIKASLEHSIDLSKSMIIGDSLSDMIAGEKANLKCKVLFRNDGKSKSNYKVITDLAEGEIILKNLIKNPH